MFGAVDAAGSSLHRPMSNLVTGKKSTWALHLLKPAVSKATACLHQLFDLLAQQPLVHRSTFRLPRLQRPTKMSYLSLAPITPVVNGAGPIRAFLLGAVTVASGKSTGELAVVLNETKPTWLPVPGAYELHGEPSGGAGLLDLSQAVVPGSDMLPERLKHEHDVAGNGRWCGYVLLNAGRREITWRLHAPPLLINAGDSSLPVSKSPEPELPPETSKLTSMLLTPLKMTLAKPGWGMESFLTAPFGWWMPKTCSPVAGMSIRMGMGVIPTIGVLKKAEQTVIVRRTIGKALPDDLLHFDNSRSVAPRLCAVAIRLVAKDDRTASRVFDRVCHAMPCSDDGIRTYQCDAASGQIKPRSLLKSTCTTMPMLGMTVAEITRGCDAGNILPVRWIVAEPFA